MRLGLIIDLTNTNRFYDKGEVEKSGIRHVKMQCKGLVVINKNIYFDSVTFPYSYIEWFQKISIAPPRRELEIPEGWGGGVKSPGNSIGEGGLTAKLTSRWFSSILYQPSSLVRKLLLTDLGGTF